MRQARTACRRNAGFTLVEITIATTIMMIAVLSAARAQITSHNLVRTSRETSTAVADLSAAMEDLLTRQKDKIPIAGSLFEVAQPIAFWEGRNLRNERIVPTYPGYVLGGTVPDPLEIVLTVTWTDWAGRGRRMTLASMKTR
jgi:type II secretory pathway pseudopilin PulG